jgi:phage gpG-like protein
MSNPFDEFLKEVKPMLTTYAREVAIDGVNFFKKSFTDQGFTNRGLNRWRSRKINKLYLRRSIKTIGGKNARTTFRLTKQAKRANHAILIKTGKLRRSIKGEANRLNIEFTANTAYAQIHNEGGLAGRNKKARIPKRQYMGESEEFMNQISDKFLKKLEQVFNK